MTRANHLFATGTLSDSLRAQAAALSDAAQGIPAGHALARSEEELVAELVDKFSIEYLVLNWDGMTVSHADAKVDVTYDTSRFIDPADGPVHVAGTRVTYHIPFSGDEQLFRLRPSTFSTVFPNGVVQDGEMRVTVTAPSDQIARVKPALDREVELIKKYVEWTNGEVGTWNAQLEGNVREVVKRRRTKVIADQELIASLGVPVQRREDAKPTYAVAPVRRQATRATAGHAARPPEPILPSEEYERILDIARSMVLVMEQSPKAFKGMGEEDLRTQFLVQLNGQYQGGATGETFNFEGKTDILVRDRGKNLFIAECKFWDGPAKLTATVDQLLGYTSWRDTKTAIFLFNRGRALTRVLAQLSPTVAAHRDFVREIAYKGETDFRFVLHHRDDPERELTLTILVFEVPGADVAS
jgi:hypothetical protein